MNTSGSTIGIVDDEACVRKALARLLGFAGMQVECFASALEFLNGLTSRPVDCVLLDLHMQELGGFDVQTRLRQSGQCLPVIILSAHDSAESRQRAFGKGAVAYLVKPVDIDELLSAIQRALRLQA